ncbi:tyrosine-protein phosphatase [Rhodococcus sp. IEGM 1408]|uniref:tyrosine-protein phosphatase n=1 Tax=Rhodococcus sp. IEGM 1408 TaxID=3082220 RepID=UPI00295506DB|nr:tyrosine-protein phosphatase [Rhodococcus sp. IEGM 1408]MDV8001954.1 tyrosine-protein phosphatase [Rhodococcus sp. IEGM 1408]
MNAEAGADAGVDEDLEADDVVEELGMVVSDVRLTTIHNFRDVAGPGYAIHPSGTMSRGLVYRSTTLTVGEEDLGVLERLGVSTIVDLRTEAEITKEPDMIPAGAEYLAIDVLAGNSSAAALTGAGTFSVEDARREMATTYDRFVLGDQERVAFGRAVHAVALSSGPAIVHCTAGKDRTGWISALLQMLAGVREEDVIADYLLTREMSVDFVTAIRTYVRAEMPDQFDAIDVLIGVEESNIRRSLDAMTKEFGDARRYLVEGAGLEDSLVDELGARLRSGR